MSESMTTVSDDYLEYLIHRSDILEALEAAGVDNWEGYSHAIRLLYEEDEK